jgi:hypothetical protein
MEQVKAPQLDPVIYRPLSKPQLEHLTPRHHPILPPRQLGNLGVNRRTTGRPIASLSHTPYFGA